MPSTLVGSTGEAAPATMKDVAKHALPPVVLGKHIIESFEGEMSTKGSRVGFLHYRLSHGLGHCHYAVISEVLDLHNRGHHYQVQNALSPITDAWLGPCPREGLQSADSPSSTSTLGLPPATQPAP